MKPYCSTVQHESRRVYIQVPVLIASLNFLVAYRLAAVTVSAGLLQ